MGKIHDYHPVLDQLKAAAEKLLNNKVAGVGVLFNTQIRNKLRAVFLTALVEEARKLGWSEQQCAELRQEYTCSACAAFFSRVGHLVYAQKGYLTSVYWNPDVIEGDELFKAVVKRLKAEVEASMIVGVYNCDGPYNGTLEYTNNGGETFRHFHLESHWLAPRDTQFRPITLHHVERYSDKITALRKLVTGLEYTQILHLDQLFQNGTLQHVQNTAANLESFKALVMDLNRIADQKPGAGANGREQRQYEVKLTNALWIYGAQREELLNIKNSLLGELIQKVKDGWNVEAIAGFWKVQSDGFHYRRPTAVAKTSSVQATADFLTENDYDVSQVVALEQEMPVFWVATPQPEEVEAPKTSSFQDFAASKLGAKAEPMDIKTQTLDTGYFINEVLPYVLDLSLDFTNVRFKPVVVNRVANLRAKPILAYDSVEVRKPFVPFSYDALIDAGNMLKGHRGENPRDVKAVFPVRSIGWCEDACMGTKSNGSIVLWLGEVDFPVPPRPALFSTALKPEFYPHRHVLENFMKEGVLALPEGERAVGLTVGYDPVLKTNSHFTLTAVLNEEGARLHGAKKLRLSLTVVANVKPSAEQWPVIRSTLVSCGNIKVDDAVDPRFLPQEETQSTEGVESPVTPV